MWTLFAMVNGAAVFVEALGLDPSAAAGARVPLDPHRVLRRFHRAISIAQRREVERTGVDAAEVAAGVSEDVVVPDGVGDGVVGARLEPEFRKQVTTGAAHGDVVLQPTSHAPLE